ncbi:unnamed protein product [Cercospora beticola]|nr:unnamed protein product [Cercospora beticola]
MGAKSCTALLTAGVFLWSPTALLAGLTTLSPSLMTTRATPTGVTKTTSTEAVS